MDTRHTHCPQSGKPACGEPVSRVHVLISLSSVNIGFLLSPLKLKLRPASGRDAAQRLGCVFFTLSRRRCRGGGFPFPPAPLASPDSRAPLALRVSPPPPLPAGVTLLRVSSSSPSTSVRGDYLEIKTPHREEERRSGHDSASGASARPVNHRGGGR